jgi:uncharacterized protein YndB with AHSA1/START domain
MTTTHQPRPTGRREQRHGETFLVFERTFRAPIEDVWAAVTESDRLARWIGEWTGDPSTGSVTFRMTAEGDDVADETIWVDECDPPRRVVMRSAQPVEPELLWAWEIDLTEADGTTTLTFAQGVTDVELAESVGPGWDYYLDRMVLAETGGDLAVVDFDDYYPAFKDHYRAQLG